MLYNVNVTRKRDSPPLLMVLDQRQQIPGELTISALWNILMYIC